MDNENSNNNNLNNNPQNMGMGPNEYNNNPNNVVNNYNNQTNPNPMQQPVQQYDNQQYNQQFNQQYNPQQGFNNQQQYNGQNIPNNNYQQNNFQQGQQGFNNQPFNGQPNYGNQPFNQVNYGNDQLNNQNNFQNMENQAPTSNDQNSNLNGRSNIDIFNDLKIEKKEKTKANNTKIAIILGIILVLVVVAMIAYLVLTKPKEEVKKNEVVVQNVEKNVTIDENTIREEAPTTIAAVELDTIAQENSTIDGKQPTYYNPIIPKGFKAIENAQDATISENAKWSNPSGYLSGLVLEDENGNQFVWVPIKNEDTFSRVIFKENIASTKEFNEKKYIEPVEEEQSEYTMLRRKCLKYGGFYVGRYETGDTDTSGERTENSSTSDGIGIRKRLIPYSYVPYTSTQHGGRSLIGAKELAMKFSRDNNYSGVNTHLMYGIEWDIILKNIVSIDKYQDTPDSSMWGNYKSSEKLEYVDNDGETKIKEKNEIKLFLTGGCEQTKNFNIYDLAGNLMEWTQETTGSNSRIVRGGNYVSELGCNVSVRSPISVVDEDKGIQNAIGFRIAMYVE